MGAVPKNCLITYIFFFLLCEELTPDICPSRLGTLCIFLMRDTTFDTPKNSSQDILFFVSVLTSFNSEMQTPDIRV